MRAIEDKELEKQVAKQYHLENLDMQFENERYVCSDCEIVFKDEVLKCPHCYGETEIADKDCFASQNSL